MHFFVCSECKHVPESVKMLLENVCPNCKTHLDDYVYIAVPEFIGNEIPNDNSIEFLRKISEIAMDSIICMETRETLEGVEISCPVAVRHEISRMIPVWMDAEGRTSVIEVPKIFTLPPLLDSFYPHSRDRADAIIDAMNETRKELVTNFMADPEFAACPEGFLFVFVDSIVGGMDGPINPGSISREIKKRIGMTRH